MIRPSACPEEQLERDSERLSSAPKTCSLDEDVFESHVLSNPRAESHCGDIASEGEEEILSGANGVSDVEGGEEEGEEDVNTPLGELDSDSSPSSSCSVPSRRRFVGLSAFGNLEDLRDAMRPAAEGAGSSSSMREALVLGGGSYRGVTLISALSKEFDKVYCVGPLSLKKKLSHLPCSNVDLIEGNVWEYRFGEDLKQGATGLTARSSKGSSPKPFPTLQKLFKPPSSSSVGGGCSVSWVGSKWEMLAKRVSHIYLIYGCFGVMSQNDYLLAKGDLDLKKQTEAKVHCMLLNALELASEHRRKRIVAYTHLSSQLAVRHVTFQKIINESDYIPFNEIIESNRKFEKLSSSFCRAGVEVESTSCDSPIASPPSATEVGSGGSPGASVSVAIASPPKSTALSSPAPPMTITCSRLATVGASPPRPRSVSLLSGTPAVPLLTPDDTAASASPNSSCGNLSPLPALVSSKSPMNNPPPPPLEQILFQMKYSQNVYSILAWVDILIEGVLMYARNFMNYDTVIFRMPSDVIGSSEVNIVRKHIHWNILDVIVMLNIFPTDLITEEIFKYTVLHPIESVMKDSVLFSAGGGSASSSASPSSASSGALLLYPIYHMIRRSEAIEIEALLKALWRVGFINVRRRSLREFQNKISKLNMKYFKTANDMIEYLMINKNHFKSFSTCLYDYDLHRLNIINKNKTNTNKNNLLLVIDNCLLSLLKRGHLRLMLEDDGGSGIGSGNTPKGAIPGFHDVIRIYDPSHLIRRSCVCGSSLLPLSETAEAASCTCDHYNLFDFISVRWSAVFDELRASLLRPAAVAVGSGIIEATDDDESISRYMRYLGVLRLCAMAINTLVNMCVKEDYVRSIPSGTGGQRQLLLFGDAAGSDMLVNIMHLNAKNITQSSVNSGTTPTSGGSTSGTTSSASPIHIVENYELLNLYGFTNFYDFENLPFDHSEHLKHDPRYLDYQTLKNLFVLSGDQKILNRRLNPYNLLGILPLVCFDLGLNKSLRNESAAAATSPAAAAAAAVFHYRVHNHLVRQRKSGLKFYVYNYHIQYMAIRPLIDHMTQKPVGGGLIPSCAIVHRDMNDMIETNDDIMIEYIRNGIREWCDFEDQMAIQFNKDHPIIQPPRHFAIPILYDDLINKPNITLNVFLTKLLQPNLIHISNSNIINDIYERYINNKASSSSSDNGIKKSDSLMRSRKITSVKHINQLFSFYHMRWKDNLIRCQTDSIIWQKIFANSIDLCEYYDKQGKMKMAVLS